MANKYCEYKGLKLGKIDPKPVTEEDVNKEIEAVLKNNPTYVEEEVSKNGSICNIDFEGFVDGVAFEGGKGEHYDLTLGSKTFIPGFEEQLLDHKKGDEVDVHVTFPEDYQAENLKGKAAVFKCKINEVKSKKEAELNDEFAAKYGFKNVDDLKKAVEQELIKKNTSDSLREYLNKVANYLVENSQIEIDANDKKVDSIIEDMLKYYEREIANYGMDLNSYLEATSKTIEEFKENLRPDALYSVKIDTIYDYIAQQEKFEATEEEIKTELEYVKQQFRFNDEQLEEFKKTRLDDCKLEIIRQKVSALLVQENE